MGLTELKDIFTGCFSTNIDPTADTQVDDSIATYVSDYATGALCVFFSLAILCANNGRTGASPAAGPTEATPLTGASTQDRVRLVRRTPYKQVLPSFFFFHGVPFILGGVRHQLASSLEDNVSAILSQTMTGAMALATSLLLGLGAMEYFIYVRSFSSIKAPLTYLWILILVGTTVGAVLVETAYLYSALYLLVVVFLYMIVSASQFKRLGRKGYNLLEVVAMVLYIATIITTFVLTKLCAGVMSGNDAVGIGCSLVCPLPVDVFNPEALFHCLVFVAVLIFGIAKLGQIKSENGPYGSPPTIVV